MTRRLPVYDPARIRETVAVQRGIKPEAPDHLVADLAAIVLTNGQADEIAEADAARQMLEWITNVESQ